MRLIDGDKLYAALDNIADHLFETKSEPQNSMAQTIQYVMGIVWDQPGITQPPNDPLSLEQLREMDGEPVWIVQINDELRPFWGLVDAEDESAASRLYCAMFEDYGTEWLAYRRKPEEGTA